MNIADIYAKYLTCGGRVTTDSRRIGGGELFFALKGENFDGNEYALKALNAGAAYAVVSKDSAVARLAPGSVDDARSRDAQGRSRLIPVEDTLEALQALARYHRSMFFVDGKPLPVIALTGTNGKTTTKELIRAVLAQKYCVSATEGNLNNSIGVPLTLLAMGQGTQIAVVEMGASHPGDIKELTSVALPNYGLITNVGKGHLLGFGSFEGVMAAKGEMYDYLQRTADKAFVNVDNPVLCRMAAQRPDLVTVPYGLEYEGAAVLDSSPEHPYLRLRLADGTVVETHLVGAYNADNVMTALAVGREFGVPQDRAVAAIEAYVPSNNRSQMTLTGRNTVVVDAYNANPTSMKAALENFASARYPRKALMLGDMLELGVESVGEHVGVLRLLDGVAGLEVVVLVGEEFRKALEVASTGAAAVIKWFATSGEAADYLAGNPVRDCFVLVKGSRGTRMETVLPEL